MQRCPSISFLHVHIRGQRTRGVIGPHSSPRAAAAIPSHGGGRYSHSMRYVVRIRKGADSLVFKLNINQLLQ